MTLLPGAMPWRGLLGGLLIGLGAALMRPGNGRIARVSGRLARGLGLSREGAP